MVICNKNWKLVLSGRVYEELAKLFDRWNGCNLSPRWNVFVALAMTLLLVVLATGSWTFLIPIAGAGAGFYFWRTKAFR
jgi:hypothetical protein